jgi:hypothetical protein
MAPEKRQEVIRLLEAGNNPRQVSIGLGIQYKTVWQIAKKIHAKPKWRASMTVRLDGFRGRRRKMVNHPNRKRLPKRSSQGLRDILFDEIEELRSGSGDPTKSMAVANLAKQIINIAKVEIDFHRQIAEQADAGHAFSLGQMELGSAASVEETVTEA